MKWDIDKKKIASQAPSDAVQQEDIAFELFLQISSGGLPK